jgi:hypothetical protein
MASNYGNLMERVRRFKKSATIDTTDPSNKGKAPTPDYPGMDRKETGMPPEEGNTGFESSAPPVTNTFNPAPTGRNVPTTENGTARDKKEEEEKIASLSTRVQNLLKATKAKTEPTKSAAAPVTTSAGHADGEVSPDMLFKLASAILSSNRGIAVANELLAEQVGREEAGKLIKQASEQHLEFVRLGYLQEEMAKEAAMRYELITHIIKQASPEDQEYIHKIAKFHDSVISQIEDPMLKMAYAQGADDAAAMTDAAEGAGGGAPQIPGADETQQPSVEELLALLHQLVESGQVSPEEAQQVAQELAQGQGGEEGGEPKEASGAFADVFNAMNNLVP